MRCVINVLEANMRFLHMWCHLLKTSPYWLRYRIVGFVKLEK